MSSRKSTRLSIERVSRPLDRRHLRTRSQSNPPVEMAPALMYAAVADGQVDAAIAVSQERMQVANRRVDVDKESPKRAAGWLLRSAP